jgi:flagellar L-ring protein precursor FlgH
MKTLRAPLLLLFLLLAACASYPEQAPPLDDGARLDLPLPVVHKGSSGGVFTPKAPWTLTSDSRAFRPGDLLTVVLLETTQASKTADTKFGKSSGVAITPSVIFGKAQPKTEVGIDASRDFAGSASSTQQNTLQGAITVVVHEVLPNGLLRISGEKSLYLNQGEEFVRLAGYVRAGDIDSDNRVSSQRVANARIAYSGRGVGQDANNAGWLTRFFTSPWMPF